MIYTSFLTLYFFVSFSFFVFTGDFLERAKKDYSKVNKYKFYEYKGDIKNFSFADSPPDTIHVVSHVKHSLNDDDKIGLINGQKIIDAINVFYDENKTYPKSLNQLVPKYLKEIPSSEYPRLWKISDYDYSYYAVNNYFKLSFSGFFEDFHWQNDRNLWEYEQD